MAWCRTGDKPLPEPVVSQLTDEYIYYTYVTQPQLTAIHIWIINHVHSYVMDDTPVSCVDIIFYPFPNPNADLPMDNTAMKSNSTCDMNKMLKHSSAVDTRLPHVSWHGHHANFRKYIGRKLSTMFKGHLRQFIEVARLF